MSINNSQGRWEYDENGNMHFVPPRDDPAQPTVDGRYRFSNVNRPPAGVPRPPEQRGGQRTKSDDAWHWALIVLGFVAAWPVGLILLFLQLSGKWPGSQTLNSEARRAAKAVQNGARQFRAQTAKTRQQSGTAQPGNYGQTMGDVQERLAREKAQQSQQQRTAQAEAQKQAEKAEKRRRKKKQGDGDAYGLGHVRLFRWIGGVMAGLFGFAFIMDLIDEIAEFVSIRSLLSETLPLLALALIGVTLILVGGNRKRKLKKFQKYLTMIGQRDRVSIDSLSEAMGIPEKKAERDLEEMLERDFWEQGYVDAARRMLVLGAPLEDTPEQTPELDQEAPDTDDTATLTLRHIREVNDAIADTEMSEKIYRIEELTGKIFKLLDERPEKAGELRSFMNYYLPETLKILESYAKLEAQGIEGENISEAKEKIEGMMDKLVDGYETQLDKLFADDVLDISADIKVMEQMLEKDGLTLENELRF